MSRVPSPDPVPSFFSFFDATARLEEALSRAPLSPLEQEGAARRFTFAADAGWKAMKNFMNAAGLPPDAPTPPSILAAAWRLHMIFDGHLWMDMLTRRSELVRGNAPETIERIIRETRSLFLPEMIRLRVWLRDHPPASFQAACKKRNAAS